MNRSEFNDRMFIQKCWLLIKEMPIIREFSPFKTKKVGSNKKVKTDLERRIEIHECDKNDLIDENFGPGAYQTYLALIDMYKNNGKIDKSTDDPYKETRPRKSKITNKGIEWNTPVE